MRAYEITVCTDTGKFTYTAIARTSCDAWEAAADSQGDTPCGITVTPAGAQ